MRRAASFSGNVGSRAKQARLESVCLPKCGKADDLYSGPSHWSWAGLGHRINEGTVPIFVAGRHKMRLSPLAHSGPSERQTTWDMDKWGESWSHNSLPTYCRT